MNSNTFIYCLIFAFPIFAIVSMICRMFIFERKHKLRQEQYEKAKETARLWRDLMDKARSGNYDIDLVEIGDGIEKNKKYVQ